MSEAPGSLRIHLLGGLVVELLAMVEGAPPLQVLIVYVTRPLASEFHHPRALGVIAPCRSTSGFGLFFNRHLWLRSRIILDQMTRVERIVA